VPDPDVLASIKDAYTSGAWGKYQGGLVSRLEQRLAEYHGVPFALCCASGTFAVELALRAVGIGPGDEVVVAAYDYPGNFLSVHAVGAHPVLVDVNPENWNLDPGKVAAAIGPATRAIIASHLHGGIVDMEALTQLATDHGLAVIEDAAQAPGSMVQGKKTGTWGDVGVLSFGGSKLLTAGRGGAILTTRREVDQRARVTMLRGNCVCPLSELQAAALLPQLDKLDARNGQRAGAVLRLRERLGGLPGLRLLTNHVEHSRAGYYKVGFQFDEKEFGLSRDLFVAGVRAEGIAVDEGFAAFHVGRSPKRFRQSGTLDVAARAGSSMAILHHPILLADDASLEAVALGFHKTYSNANRLASGWRPASASLTKEAKEDMLPIR
jgi:dTDP-4-amino-4,6-dideoxygalactose transaminase